jgi:hypothetical protein
MATDKSGIDPVKDSQQSKQGFTIRKKRLRTSARLSPSWQPAASNGAASDCPGLYINWKPIVNTCA